MITSAALFAVPLPLVATISKVIIFVLSIDTCLAVGEASGSPNSYQFVGTVIYPTLYLNLNFLLQM